MFTNNKILSTDLSTGIPQGVSIFAIFVHFGSWEVTNAAVASLRAGTVSPDYVIIVDHSQENMGYAAGLADGLKQAAALGAKETDLCLLLNNDVEFKKDSLYHITSWWEKNGGPNVLAGAAGGYVSLFSGRAHILPYIVRDRYWNIPYIHGSCMVGVFGLFASLSFPFSFFMYWEDIAISMLVCRKNGALAVIPGLLGVHNDSHTGVSSQKLYYMVRNGAYVLERLTPLLWRLYWYSVNTLRMVYHWVFRITRHKIIARALLAARRGHLGRANI